MEYGFRQQELITSFFLKNNFDNIEIFKDFSNCFRAISAVYRG